ncbi:MAG: hypothetical protein FWF26_02075, partial [Treponema sp.]|nr:hypothetical protein [Treponema sp.]
NAAGERAAVLFTLNGTRGDFTNSSFGSSGRDYASVLEATGSELLLSGGTLEASARDATVLLFDRSIGLISGAQFRVDGSFSASAVEIRGAFPVVQNSRFVSSGSAKRSEVFSGTDVPAPKPQSIRGNSFSAFTHIWGGAWPLEKLQIFNQTYASEGMPNSAEEAPDRPAASALDLSPVIIP